MPVRQARNHKLLAALRLCPQRKGTRCTEQAATLQRYSLWLLFGFETHMR
jgi:hypothetical protein